MRAAFYFAALAASLVLSLSSGLGADSIEAGAVNEAPAPQAIGDVKIELPVTAQYYMGKTLSQFAKRQTRAHSLVCCFRHHCRRAAP